MGVGPESLVALAMRRSVDLIVGMYAVAKAGGAYVPIDPDHPADRTAYILDTAQPVCVLATSREDVETPAHLPVLHVDLIDGTEHDGRPITDRERTSPLRPANTAYVIFTSGSTGRPKGVAVSHAAIVTSWNGSAPNTDWTPRMPRCSRPRRPSTCRCGSSGRR